jgi:HSP20 family protein
MYTTSLGQATINTAEETYSPINMDANNSWVPEAVPQLTVDMYYQDDFIFVVSTVAGVQASDLDIVIEGGVLYLKGIRRQPYVESEVDIELNECFWGEFARDLVLPDSANVDEIDANLSNGILIIKIPITRPKTRKVQIRVN